MMGLPDVALTVRQPFAWAIAEGLKLLEIRKRPPPKKYIGQRIALHVSVVRPKKSDLARVGEMVRHERPVIHMSDIANQQGCIIATFLLEGFVNAQGAKTLGRDLYRWWNPRFGGYGWVLRDVVKFHELLPAHGQLGFWRLEHDLRSEVIARQVLASPLKRATDMRDAAKAAGLWP